MLINGSHLPQSFLVQSCPIFDAFEVRRVMGNALGSYPCCSVVLPDRPITLILCQGAVRKLSGKKRWLAGQIMFEFPECMVCHADSFYIGQPVPALGVHDRLGPGQTYFVIPIDRLAASNVLSAANLSSLSPNPGSVKFGNQCPFEFLKGGDGRGLIKVSSEFIIKMITGDEGCDQIRVSSGGSPLLCSTPELQKRYDELVVRYREQVWSPSLEPISEHKVRFSPCRLIGLEWKVKEKL